MKTTLETANIIAEQIGHRAFYMMGTTVKLGDDNGLTFDVRGSRACNKIRVELDRTTDTYTVQFLKIRGTDVRIPATVCGVYADALNRTIEINSGLYLSL